MTNISTCNNLIVSGNQTISGNILSSRSLKTTAISSTSINNSSSISTNSLNGTSGSLTNLSVSNILTLLSASPIKFVYNGNQYNLSALMLYSLYALSDSNIASQQISNLVNGSPDLLNTLNELAAANNNDSAILVTMNNLIATKVG